MSETAKTTCVIDWRAFGLGDGGDTGCTGRPIVVVMQACEHEHVAAAKVCGPCLAEFVNYGEPGDWTCGPCLALGHQCMAPLDRHRPDRAESRKS